MTMTLERDWRILGGTRMVPQEGGNRGQAGQGGTTKEPCGRKERGGEQGNSANRRNVNQDPTTQSGKKRLGPSPSIDGG